MYAFKHTAPRAPLSSSVAWDQQKNQMRAAIATEVSLVEIAGNALPTQAQQGTTGKKFSLPLH